MKQIIKVVGKKEKELNNELTSKVASLETKLEYIGNENEKEMIKLHESFKSDVNRMIDEFTYREE